MNSIQFKSIYFYTQLDFDLMCEWLNAIASVENYEFDGNDLSLTFKPEVSNEDFLELICIADRYGLSHNSFDEHKIGKDEYWCKGPKFQSIYPSTDKDKKIEADKNASIMRLECTPISLYTQLDKNNMFEWIERNLCVAEIIGLGPVIYLYVSQEKIDDEALRNLVGLFNRYYFDLQQLTVFMNNDNKHWLNKLINS